MVTLGRVAVFLAWVSTLATDSFAGVLGGVGILAMLGCILELAMVRGAPEVGVVVEAMRVSIDSRIARALVGRFLRSTPG
jgi:hypothetical protein